MRQLAYPDKPRFLCRELEMHAATAMQTDMHAGIWSIRSFFAVLKAT